MTNGNSGRMALVIGSNRGIGLEVCRQLAQRGDRVVAACRRSSPELNALDGVRIEIGVDVSDLDSVTALSRKLEPGSVDLLMVVAGILRPVSLEGFDPAVVRDQLEVNALGPIQTTVALRDRLRSGGKVGLLTSRMGSIADNTSGGGYGYRMSKAALNMGGVSLAHDLKPDGIAVALLHPGWVQTEMTGGTGHLSAAESAAGLLERMDELTLESSGIFVHQSGEVLPW